MDKMESIHNTLISVMQFTYFVWIIMISIKELSHISEIIFSRTKSIEMIVEVAYIKTASFYCSHLIFYEILFTFTFFHILIFTKSPLELY